ncbi:MAG: hypothetical protein IBX58_14425 [Roseovarius sp.]|nr:hypothetical protein [Roseovarius sp.]
MGPKTKTLTALQRRLDAIAIDQLRKEVVMLRERLDRTEARADKAEAEAARAWECADEWREDYFDAQPGLTTSGKLVPVVGGHRQ